MKNRKFYIVTIFYVLLIFSVGCNDKLSDYVGVNKDVDQRTITEYLNSKSEYSEFLKLVKEVGLEEKFDGSVVYTLYLPTNEAMQQVPSDVLESDEKKTAFVNHHFTLGRKRDKQEHFKMLSNKYLVLDKVSEGDVEILKIGDSKIITSGNFLKNGVVYGIDKILVPTPSVWEYIETVASKNNHINFINSITRDLFDEEISEQIGYNEHGLPIYDSIFVATNEINARIADLAAEDSTYTIIIVDDTAYDLEVQKFNPYFRVEMTDRNQDPTDLDLEVAQIEIMRDYIFDTNYSVDELPDEMYSINGVKVTIDKANIISTFNASNGTIYTLSSCPIEYEEKFPVVIIEGEQIDKFFGYGKDGNSAQGYLRVNPKASGGKDFVLDNHGGNALEFGLVLKQAQLPSVRYNVYWRAIDDFDASIRYPSVNDTISQRLSVIGAPRYDAAGNITDFGGQQLGAINTSFIKVEKKDYSDNPEDDETYIGRLNNTKYQDVYFQLVPEGSFRRMSVTLDYIKLVPDFN